MKKLIMILVVFSAFHMMGCSFNPLTNTASSMSDPAAEQEALGKKIVGDSEQAFNDLLGSVSQTEVSEPVMIHSNGQYIENSNLKVCEVIAMLAFEAFYSKDESAFRNYLKKHDLLDKYNDIVNKYQINENYSKYMNNKMQLNKVTTLGIPNQNFAYYGNGDIFLTSSFMSIAGIIPGYWKHAGIFKKDKYLLGNRYAVLTAYGDFSGSSSGILENGADNCVGYESVDHYVSADDFTIRRVANWSDDSVGLQAVQYGENFLGRPYSIFNNVNDDNAWYCSKVAYRSWVAMSRFSDFNTNKELHKFWPARDMVLPQDLYDNTSDLSYPVPLISPANKTRVFPGLVRFSWFTSSIISHYELVISKLENGVLTDSNIIVYPNVGASSASCDVDMRIPGDYYWKVNCFNKNGTKEIMQNSRFIRIRPPARMVSISRSATNITGMISIDNNIMINFYNAYSANTLDFDINYYSPNELVKLECSGQYSGLISYGSGSARTYEISYNGSRQLPINELLNQSNCVISIPVMYTKKIIDSYPGYSVVVSNTSYSGSVDGFNYKVNP